MDLTLISEKIQAGRAKEVKALVQQALDEGVDPNRILNEGLMAGMAVVGERFKNGEAFVPEVLVAARAMNKGAEILKPVLAAAGVKASGKACIGTVKGDLHDVGKNLVKMMLESKGLEVVDLGTDVPPEKFVEAARDQNCRIVCCSALLTTTMPVMRDVVEAFKAAGLRDKVRIMIGGAPITDAFCKEIGADVYTSDAARCSDVAVEYAREAANVSGNMKRTILSAVMAVAPESHEQGRRAFLADAGLAAMAIAVGGCASGRPKIGGAGAMSNFAAPPLARIRVGVVGVGLRGTSALKRLACMPGVEIAAFCDIDEAAMKRSRDFLALKKLHPAREFFGPVAYKDLCQWDGVDVVYACVPWKLHAPVALAAMRGQKHAFVEVPATMDVESCWELVETSEATRRHCMMLENCCYGEHEMLALNMCRLGVLGETVYGEAGYLHSGKTRGFKLSGFRAEWYQEHRGNYYPTHGLGPVAQYMNINRGDRFEYLNSMESSSVGDLIRAGDARWNGENLEAYRKYLIGGYSSSLIHTVNGKVILLNLSCQVPHPYSRINTIQGTHGVFMDYPLRIDVEDEPGSGPHEKRDLEFNDRFDRARTAAYREKYRHPLWKQAGELAKKSGGHGGMDFLMDLRWVYCLQNGLPLDMDVYDLAAWSCLCEITEKSQSRRGAPVDIPDFTRGAWKTMKPLGIVTVDLEKMGTFPA